MRGHLCQINTWYEIPPLALSKSGKGSKRNYVSSQPIFSSSLFIKKLCSIVIIVWHIGKCKKIFLPVRRRGGFHILFKKCLEKV